MRWLINGLVIPGAFALLTNTALAGVAVADPFASANRNPLVQFFGIPGALDASALAAGERRLALTYELASHASASAHAGEAIVLDGETQRLELGYRYALNQTWSVGAQLPWLRHSGGSLDGFIDDWHRFFSLPEGDRDELPQDRLNYAYRREGMLLVDLQDTASGIGDLSLYLSRQLRQSDTQSLALELNLKLPTGDADQLLGSGSTDIALGLNYSQGELLGSSDWRWHASAGLLYMTDADLLPRWQRDWVFYASTTLAWMATERLSLKVQLDGHSAFYDSELDELGSPSLQLLLGGSLALSERWVLDLAVSEDIAVRTAPDVVLRAGLRYHY